MAVVVISLFLICFLASIIGAICGVGGGVIIKPVVDAFGLLTISQASFLSGCTVLAMSAYSTTMMVVKKEKGLEVKTAVPLGIGAAVGGTAVGAACVTAAPLVAGFAASCVVANFVSDLWDEIF